ncbi:hypothetical protein P691DRAFT_763638 [Macrolepiota fuliginosa MF-IS2]|uniref:Uncharacterized protein n=1 Tax=Macrolepiota fuliginosa MF-IS2 TaxID=1400762 RepID=A0A9P6C027_9AGAR|nr:hypothetical protein P691DRAFT_763638 [Macrolepiota fuliginosa MF-IS2]
MVAPVSFKRASNFTISGGNFGEVEGDVVTVNSNDTRSLRHLVEQLDLDGRHPRRLRESSRQRRTQSFRPVSRSSISSEHSMDSEYSNNGGASVHPHSHYSSVPTPTNAHRDVPIHPVVPPTNTLGLDGVPPLENHFQPARRSHREPNARHYNSQMQPRTDSTTSTLPPYPGRSRPPSQGSRDPTHVMATAESYRPPSSYTRPSPASTHTTLRQRVLQPIPLPMRNVGVTTHTRSATPPVVAPTPLQEPALRQRATPHTQSPFPGHFPPPITGTASSLPPHIHAPRPTFATNVVRQASHFSPRSTDIREVRGSPFTSGYLGEGSADFNSDHYQQVLRGDYVDHDQRGHRVVPPYGQQYTAVPVPPSAAVPSQGHGYVASPASDGGAPQPQWTYWDGVGWRWCR